MACLKTSISQIAVPIRYPRTGLKTESHQDGDAGSELVGADPFPDNAPDIPAGQILLLKKKGAITGYRGRFKELSHQLCRHRRGPKPQRARDHRLESRFQNIHPSLAEPV